MRKTINGKWHIVWMALLFALLIYFPIFLHLENFVLRLWDEARLANNAFEMYAHGNYLVPHFAGHPDMWNTKPPLMIWLQTLFFHVFGPNTLTVRLPAALAAVGVASTLLLFAVRYLRSYWYGFLMALVLVSAPGFIDIHVSRTGDYDTLLILFMTIYALSFFLFLKTKLLKFLHLFFIALGLSVLTKSIQGVLFLPAIFLLLFLKKEHLSIFRNKWLYIDALLLVLIIGAYYLGREQLNPGYLEAVWQNELGGRYANTIEGHDHGFWFYFNFLLRDHFKYWIWLVPIGVISAFVTQQRFIRHLVLFSFWLALTYWLIISAGATKLEWYIAPAIPLLSIIAATPIYLLFHYLSTAGLTRFQLLNNVLAFTFLIIATASPYLNIIKKVHKANPINHDSAFFHMSYYLRDQLPDNDEFDDLLVCNKYYDKSAGSGHILFYARTLNESGRNIHLQNWRGLKTDDLVAANNPEIIKGIERNYEFRLMDQYHTVKIYKINGTKTTPPGD